MLAVDLLGRCAATSRSRPKREASRCLAVDVALEVGTGVGRDFGRAGVALVVFEAADEVRLPL